MPVNSYLRQNQGKIIKTDDEEKKRYYISQSRTQSNKSTGFSRNTLIAAGITVGGLALGIGVGLLIMATAHVSVPIIAISLIFMIGQGGSAGYFACKPIKSFLNRFFPSGRSSRSASQPTLNSIHNGESSTNSAGLID